MKGIRKECVSVPAVPPPLEPLGLGSVRDHLNPEAPNSKQEDFTAQQWENISKIEQKLKDAITKGKLKKGSIVVAAVDRADGKVFKQNWQVNLSPCLTTTNAMLLVFSTHDLDAPREDRELFRTYLPEERLTLQGFGKERTGVISH